MLRAPARLGTTLQSLFHRRAAHSGVVIVNAKNHTRNELQQMFEKNGHLVIDNTGCTSAEEFGKFAQTFFSQKMSYYGGTNSRNELAQGVLDVGTEPPHLTLPQHNEMVYHDEVPSKLIFGCITPPKEGGVTTLAPNSSPDDLPTKLVERLFDQGIQYTRLFTDKENFTGSQDLVYKHWQDAFPNSTREEVTRFVESFGYQPHWTDEHLSFTYRRQVIREHPLTGEKLFFNGALAMNARVWFRGWKPFDTVDPQYRPFDTRWGNGEAFSQAELDALEEASLKNVFSRPWESGTMYVLDNLKYTHGRTSYDDKDRNICVSMGDLVRVPV